MRKRISEDKTWAICKKGEREKISAWSGWNRIFAGNEVLTDAGCWDTCWQNRSGTGLMTEAVQEVLRYAFEELSLELVSTYRFSYNQRSGRVMEKMGFVWEGTLRDATERFDGALLDVMCYSISRKEYEELAEEKTATEKHF